MERILEKRDTAGHTAGNLSCPNILGCLLLVEGLGLNPGRLNRSPICYIVTAHLNELLPSCLILSLGMLEFFLDETKCPWTSNSQEACNCHETI